MSLYSDLVQKPYIGLSKPSTNVLRYTAAQAELQVIATDATATGVDSGILRLRNVYQSTAAGPNIYMEGTNNAAGVVNLGHITAKFIATTAGAEDSYLSLAVLKAGAPSTVELYDGEFRPGTSADVSLGSLTSQWGDLYLGNGARVVKFTSLGPVTAAAVEADVNGFDIIVNSTQVLATVEDHVRVGSSSPSGYESTACLAITTLTTAASAIGAVSTLLGTGKTAITSFLAAPNLGAVGNLTSVIDFMADPDTSGATATNHFMFYAAAGAFTATNRYGFYGGVASAVGAYNLYMAGTAPNLMIGNTGIGNAASVSTYALDVATSTAALPAMRVRNSNATPTGDVLMVQGGGSGTGYYTLRALDSAGTLNRFAVRGDGAIFANTATVTDTSLVNINGRVSLITNSTHDIGAGVIAASLAISTAIAVADTKQNEIVSIRVPLTLAGTGAAIGGFFNLTASASSAASSLRGLYTLVSNAGAGFSSAATLQASGSVGHTGTLYGAHIITTVQATTAAAYAVVINHTGTLTAAVYVSTGVPGDLLANGFIIDSSNMLTGTAYSYTQRSGSTGQFLQYTDSGGTPRFLVDSSGDLTFGGTARRIKADMDNATQASRFAFMTSTVNANSTLGIMPNGTATTSQLRAYNASTPDAAGSVNLGINSTTAYITSGHTGSTTKPFALQIEGVDALLIPTNRDVVLGPTGAVTTMTAGYPYLPAVAGVPTGVPTSRAGYVPFVYDSTNNYLYVYNGGWKKSSVYA